MVPSICLFPALKGLDSIIYWLPWLPVPSALAALRPILRFGTPFSADRPRLRSNPARLRGYRLSVATADLAAGLHLACEPCILLGSTTADLAMISACMLLALLQLLWRSAADIVREDTDREMATFLMVPLAPPDPYVQALVFEPDSIKILMSKRLSLSLIP